MASPPSKGHFSDTTIKYKIFTLFLNPKYAPTNVSGTEIPNQRASRASKVVNGIAALDPSIHNTRFKIKNRANTIL